MNMTGRIKLQDSVRTTAVSFALVAGVVACTLCLPGEARGQSVVNNSGRSAVTCSSNNGQRVYCNADTRGGVRLVRQISGSSCQQDSTWGYDSRGIWVDRGCRAEFEIAGRGSAFTSGSGGAANTIRAGTTISVRTNETIDVRNSDGQVFRGVVDQNVVDGSGNVAIPKGSGVELLVKNASNRDLTLDLESVTVNGHRYAVSAGADRIASGRRDGLGKNTRTAEFMGGGALLGTIVGAIAGGGKGAAIGAAAGAGAGAGTQALTRGNTVNVPAESLLTFRLDQPLQMAAADHGFTRNGRHYHYRNR